MTALAISFNEGTPFDFCAGEAWYGYRGSTVALAPLLSIADAAFVSDTGGTGGIVECRSIFTSFVAPTFFCTVYVSPTLHVEVDEGVDGCGCCSGGVTNPVSTVASAPSPRFWGVISSCVCFRLLRKTIPSLPTTLLGGVVLFCPSFPSFFLYGPRFLGIWGVADCGWSLVPCLRARHRELGQIRGFTEEFEVCGLGGTLGGFIRLSATCEVDI
jgi:hypothetical protein